MKELAQKERDSFFKNRIIDLQSVFEKYKMIENEMKSIERQTKPRYWQIRIYE